MSEQLETNKNNGELAQDDPANQIAVEDIFGAEGLDDEFSDLEELPDSDDEGGQKHAANAPTSANVDGSKSGSAAPAYEFTLPRFKKRDHHALDVLDNEEGQDRIDGEGREYTTTDGQQRQDNEERSDIIKIIKEANVSIEMAFISNMYINININTCKAKSSAAKDFMDSVMKDIKGSTSRSKRRRKDGDLDEVTRMDDQASALKRAMQKAALQDLDSHANEQPGFAKLMLLEQVVLSMNKVDMHDAFMDANILEAIRVWLEPFADRSLPPLDIQEAMFKILDDLPISTDHLRESGVGRVTLFYVKNKKVQAPIQRLADRLINKWSRPILGLSDDYRTKRLPTTSMDERAMSPRPRSSGSSGGNKASSTSSFLFSSNNAGSQRRQADAVDTSSRGSAVASARAHIPSTYLPTFEVMPLPDQNVHLASANAKNKDPLKRIKQKMNLMKRQSSPGGKR
ncbi:hypothetical protein BDF19DRAFT_453304 [Syncephalis fuscata]|nr:hypothetical protein BDF19DRAFT_453304 [Syncephalis fuscata]